MKRIALLFGLMIGTAVSIVDLPAALADATSATVTVGPNADKGVGYGTYEGAKILTLTITPQSGYKIVSSECIDNAGTGIWYLASASDSEHVWKTYGVLPNFMTDESHAAIVHGTLAPTVQGAGTSVIPFDVKVSDIDIDVDALGRHVDAIWTPTDPSTEQALNDLEDKCEAGDSGGLAMPVTDPGASLPATFSADTGKALRVCLNAKKPGSVAFSGMGDKLAIYRQSGSQQTKVTGIDGITTSGLREILYLHTCTGFTDANVIAEFTAASEAVSTAKDTVRIYLATNGYQLYVNTPATTDDYVPVEALGRVPVTVTRNPYDAAVADLKLKDANSSTPILFYDAKTGGTGVAEKTFTMAVGTASQTFWISGDAAGTGARTIKLYEKNGQSWDEKKSLDVTVFNIQKIPLGGNANLSKYIIGKVYVPTKWGGTLTVSGSTADLSYSDGKDLTVDMAIDILKGDFQLAGGSPYTVPKNQYGWYYVKIAATSATAISAKFQQVRTVPKAPWRCDFYPMASDLTPNLYVAGGCLAKYDAAYGSASLDVEKKSVIDGGHFVAKSLLKESDAERTWGRDFNGNHNIDDNIPLDFYNKNTGKFENGDHDTDDEVSASWWGHCDEATAVMICENEPTGSTGTFTADDKKGLLVALYHGFSTGNTLIENPLPHNWHQMIEKRILGDNKMFGADVYHCAPGEYKKKWNHAIPELTNATYIQKPNQTDEKIVEITCQVKYWDHKDGSLKPLHYWYNVQYANGEASTSQAADWKDDPSAAPQYTRPDSVWVPEIQTSVNPYWNGQLDYTNIRNIVPAP